jgi:hypothetical protein
VLADAPDPDDPGSIRRASQRDHLHDGARVRRMDHTPAPDVDADVSEPGEDEHVAGAHPRTCDAPARIKQRVRAVRERDAESCVRPVDEPRAVKAGRRRGASPAIWHPHLFDGKCRCAIAEGSSRPLVAVPRRFMLRCRRCRVVQNSNRAAEQRRGECARQQAAAERGRHGRG